jgi:hypothetical protein
MGTPRTSDGKPIVMSSSFPGNVFYYVTGAGDGEKTRGDGETFGLRAEGSEPRSVEPVEFDFVDPVYVSGGAILWTNAVFGDHVTLETVIPATPAPSSTPGTGNCNLVFVGAGNLIVPAPGNGSHTVDLATAVPVPAVNEETGDLSGFWDWSSPDTGRGAISASKAPGDAPWNLLDFAPPPVRFMNRFLLLGDGRVDIDPPIKPKKILPHWKFRVSVHSAGRQSGTLDLVWSLKTGRARTA